LIIYPDAKAVVKFLKIIPTEKLRPYIKHLVITESIDERTYKVFPSTGLVIGLQYKGRLTDVTNDKENVLATAGITGLQNRVKIFRNSPGIGTILIFFTETGITYFSNTPADELFNQSVSLDNIINKDKIAVVEEKLAIASTDAERIKLVERFLLSEIKERKADNLVIEAVKLIYASRGAIRIKELGEKLCISQSPFEKRFRKSVGTSPKKFASIVRFNAVLNNIGKIKSLTEICYENNFFDQAHFIKDFKQYTGDTPENFKRFL